MLRVGMMSENVNFFKDLKTSLKVIKDLGYECADITLTECHNPRRLHRYFSGEKYLERAKELKEYADSINLPLVQAHAPFPVYKPHDYSYNKRMFEKLIKSIKICGVLGIKNVVIHPWNDFTDEENIKFFNKLIPYATKANVIICTENMWNWDTTIDKAKACACSLDESFVKVVRGTNSEYLKACVDIGHAEMFRHLGESPKSMIEALGKDVYCLHIHDNDGIHDNHAIPFTGVIDYYSVATALKNINYQNDLIIETVLDRDIKTFDEALNFFKRQLECGFRIKEMILK